MFPTQPWTDGQEFPDSGNVIRRYDAAKQRWVNKSLGAARPAAKTVTSAALADWAATPNVISLALPTALNTAPVSPTAGSVFVVGPTPTPSTDAFFGQANKIATFDGVAWSFLSPVDGFTYYDLGSRSLQSWNASLGHYQSSIPAVLFDGGLIHTGLSISPAGASADFHLNKPNSVSGISSVVYGENGSLKRWAMALGDGVAEAGANSGSNFVLYRFDDTGNFLAVCLQFNRSTGAISLEAAGVQSIASQLVNDPTARATLNGSIGVPSYWNGTGQIPPGVYTQMEVGSGSNYNVGVQFSAASSPFSVRRGNGSYLTVNYGTWTALGLNGASVSANPVWVLVFRNS